MLVGLFLSKFDREALKCLGFSSFSEAFNVLGYAIGGKPTSIKNYMQEFDPLFPNSRQGWHKRPIRDHCRETCKNYGHLSLLEFFRLLSPMLLVSGLPLPAGMEELFALDHDNFENEGFSKRLTTGAAAEGFFESSFPKITDFCGHTLTNVTRFGCGFDFRLDPADSQPFLAVEVKGIAEASGEILMTQKEHQVARYLRDRYFLCVVKNFVDTPNLTLFQNPLEKGLRFISRERQQSAITWHARVPA